MILSITPELALDEGYTYTGGLGVLEGDKFYGAARLDVSYKTLTFLYREAFVDYNFDNDTPIPKIESQPQEFLRKLVHEGDLTVELRNEKVKVEILKYCKGKAEAVFFNPREPEWAYHLTDQLYMEKSAEEKFYKYSLLARASAEYVRRFIAPGELDYVDLQESYTAFLPLILKIPGKFRLVVHTPGRWGHPSFPNHLFKQEFGFSFINGEVVLTDVGLAASSEAFTVSAKHLEVMSKVVPHFADKLRYVTNGVDIERWMDPRLKASYEAGNIDADHFTENRNVVKRGAADFIRRFKDIDAEDMAIVSWCRRITPYKRPDFVVRAIQDIPDKNVVFVLGGRAHPYDGSGLEFVRVFHKLHVERENVVYIPGYTVSTAKELVKAADMMLFTPMSGMEACGTSYMKGAVNGVPTLASRDGGALELIKHGFNGWFFGKERREIVDPVPERIEDLDDYQEFKGLLENALNLYAHDTEKYYEVALNALQTSVPRVGVERVLKEYYPEIIKTTSRSSLQPWHSWPLTDYRNPSRGDTGVAES